MKNNWSEVDTPLDEFREEKTLWLQNFHAVSAEHEVKIDVFQDFGVVTKHNDGRRNFKEVGSMVPIAVDKRVLLRNDRIRPIDQEILVPQQNLWVALGVGRSPSA